MSKKKPVAQNNLFTIFVVLAGLGLIGAVVLMSKSDSAVINVNSDNTNGVAVGGAGQEDTADIQKALDKINLNEAVEINENIASIVEDDSSQDNYGITLLENATVNAEGEIVSYQFGGGNVVNIMPLSYKSLVLNETSVVSREDMVIDGQDGEKITMKSAKDGSEVVIIQVETTDYLYDMRGSEEFINNINSYLNFN